MYTIKRSNRKNKKWMVILPSGKKIHYGAIGYSDYTKHKDNKRKERYLARHRKREDWTKNGIDTAGFWSRYHLWNKPNNIDSLQDIADEFDIEINFLN